MFMFITADRHNHQSRYTISHTTMLVYNLLTKLCSQNMQIDPILQAKQLKAMTSDDIPYYES